MKNRKEKREPKEEYRRQNQKADGQEDRNSTDMMSIRKTGTS